jgi:hypothetical protein
VQHPHTGRYLLYVNYVRKDGGYGGNAVFESPRPDGPFALVQPVMNLVRLCPGPAAAAPCGSAQGGAGDFDVFVDPADGAGYVVYGANFWLSIERLAPDMLSSLGTNATWLAGPYSGSVRPADGFTRRPLSLPPLLSVLCSARRRALRCATG